MNSFLQSSAWEKFQQSLGRKTWRVGENLVIRHNLPGGFNYLYSPRSKSVTNNWLLGIKKIAEEENAIFLKIDPVVRFSIFNFQFSISDPIQPGKTAIIDLIKSEGELLSAMHEKTRYNIRLAERKGVSSIKYQELSIKDEMPEYFWGLLRETAKRDKFSIHPREHYEKLFRIRDDEFSNEIFFAEYRKKIVAVIFINFYKPSGTATYLHGASGREQREVMAPHLLHWYVIKEAKARGLKFYDLWGIDEKRWPGLTRFKLGFGSNQVEYPPSVDIIYRPALYKVYKYAKFLRY